MILGVDPGTEQSAFVILNNDLSIIKHGILPNKDILTEFRLRFRDYTLAYEMMACYGMPVGSEVYETVLWLGQFLEAHRGEQIRVYRKDIKMYFCHSMKANDSTIRQAIVDRYGGKDKAIGNKKTPGKLYGIKADEWSALAIALYAQEYPSGQA